VILVLGQVVGAQALPVLKVLQAQLEAVQVHKALQAPKVLQVQLAVVLVQRATLVLLALGAIQVIHLQAPRDRVALPAIQPQALQVLRALVAQQALKVLQAQLEVVQVRQALQAPKVLRAQLGAVLVLRVILDHKVQRVPPACPNPFHPYHTMFLPLLLQQQTPRR